MDSFRYTREEDKVQAVGPLESQAAIDVTQLLGTWVNTNTKSKGISRLVISRADDGVTVNVFGLCDGSSQAWGEIRADFIYSRRADSRDPMGFTAFYDFGFMETRLQANLSLGLLVVAGLNTFKDESGRSNYFSREFFHR